MGLFGTSIDDPRTAAMFGLSAQLMGSQNVGQGLMSGMQDYMQQLSAARDHEMKRRLLQAQLDETAAQADERKTNAAKMQAALDQQQKQRELMAGLFKPTTPIDANAASGITGPRPEALTAVGKTAPVNYQQLIAAGIPHETVKALAEAKTYGQPKVARVEEVMVNGVPVKVQLDEQGNRVGDPFGVWKAPVQMDFGGTAGMVDPVTRGVVAQFRKSMTPDAAASNALGYARLGEERRHNQSAERNADLSVTYQQDENGNLVALPTKLQGGVRTPTPMPVVDAGGKPVRGKLGETQQKQVVGVANLRDAIDEYRTALKGWNATDALKMDSRADMGMKYNNMLLQAKEAYNLGVLNGPDYAILQQVVTDPASIKGAFTSNVALDKQAKELDRIMEQISSTVQGKGHAAERPAIGSFGGSRPPLSAFGGL